MWQEEEDSVTQWIARVKANDDRAAQCLYQRYLQWLTALARTRLNGSRRRIVDEEDVAHAVLANFFNCAKRGAFARLESQVDLWQVLDGDAPTERVLQCIERCLDLFARLGDPLLERIFLLKLAGYDHAEIARELGCVRRTVQRKLLVIRELWEAGEGGGR